MINSNQQLSTQINYQLKSTQINNQQNHQLNNQNLIEWHNKLVNILVLNDNLLLYISEVFKTNGQT